MAESAKKTGKSKKRAPTLYFHHYLQIDQGRVSLLLALGVYKMTGAGLSDLFDRLVHWMHLDPENRFLSEIGDQVGHGPHRPMCVGWSSAHLFTA